MSIFTINNPGDSRFKSWVKKVDSVDLTKDNGYAFGGEFLEFGKETDLKIGDVIIKYYRTGSRNRNEGYADVGVVEKKVDGKGFTIKYVIENWDYHGKFLTLRNKIAKILKDIENPPPMIPVAIPDPIPEIKTADDITQILQTPAILPAPTPLETIISGNDLYKYSDSDLIVELEKRGFKVEKDMKKLDITLGN